MEILAKIKIAEMKDAELISKLAKEIWSEHYSAIISENQINYMLKNFQSEDAIKSQITAEGYIYFIAYVENEPLAYSSFKLDGGKIFLSKLYVKKEWRGMGIAKTMLDEAINYFDIKNTEIYLTVNKNNIITIAAYRKLGFEISEDIVVDIGNGFVMDDYKMVKKI